MTPVAAAPRRKFLRDGMDFVPPIELPWGKAAAKGGRCQPEKVLHCGKRRRQASGCHG
jgi:hypothetical protein